MIHSPIPEAHLVVLRAQCKMPPLDLCLYLVHMIMMSFCDGVAWDQTYNICITSPA